MNLNYLLRSSKAKIKISFPKIKGSDPVWMKLAKKKTNYLTFFARNAKRWTK